MAAERSRLTAAASRPRSGAFVCPALRVQYASAMSRRGIRAAGVTALALGLVALITWPIAASVARGGVAVYPDARNVICEGGKASFKGDGDPVEETFTTSVTAAPGLNCYMRFHLRNDGAFPAYLHGATYPFGGPESRGGVRVDMIDYQETAPSGDGYDSTLTEDTAMEILPGDNYLLVAHFVFNPSACLAESTSVTTLGPEITLSSLGIPATTEPTFGGLTVMGTKESRSAEGCS